jgi:hypothetical protein
MPAINTRAIGATSNETPSVPRKLANRLVVLVAFNVADEVLSNATDDAPTPVASTAASTANDVVDLRSPIKMSDKPREWAVGYGYARLSLSQG